MKRQRDAAYAARLERRIAHRWLFWEPWVVRWWRQRFSEETEGMFGLYKERYMDRLTQCTMLGLPWTTIVKYKLDDPLADQGTYVFNLNAAVERRRQKKERHAHSSRNRL
jgi:hypothetical protein